MAYTYEDDEIEVSNIIELTDEEGNEVSLEFITVIEYEGEEYVVLLPLEEDSQEVVILKCEEEEDEETYTSVEAEAVLNAVFEIFKERFQDEFDFKDEE